MRDLSHDLVDGRVGRQIHGTIESQPMREQVTIPQVRAEHEDVFKQKAAKGGCK